MKKQKTKLFKYCSSPKARVRATSSQIFGLSVDKKEYQILSTEAMFLYCQEKISGIEFKYIPIEEIQSTRENIREHLSQAKTVPGTRSFHQFIPISSSIIGTKRVSEEVDFALRFSFGEEQLEGVEARVGQFVVCNYDKLYWAGMLIEVDNDMHDVNVKFMHPSPPLHFFEVAKKR